MKIADPILAKTGQVMSMLDLGIDGVFTIETLSFETSSEVTAEYIENLKRTLTEGFESDGWRVYGVVVKVLT